MRDPQGWEGQERVCYTPGNLRPAVRYGTIVEATYIKGRDELQLKNPTRAHSPLSGVDG